MSADAGILPDHPDSTTVSSAVFTVPAGQPFLSALARAILNGDLPRAGGSKPQPFDLADITILLPTRRAARGLQQAFLDISGERTLLLPRIRPIAEGEEDLTLLSGLAISPMATAESGIIPPSISELERRLVLTQLVQRWSEAIRPEGDEPYAAAGARTPAQAANLARELAGLIDMVETEGGNLDGLADLVPENFSEHWQKTLEFLQIVLNWWPAYLDERAHISPMARRNRLILAEARHLQQHAPQSPMIVAGVTGSIPATTELMRAVMSLKQGAIVLPGLDGTLDDESWSGLSEHPEHPQYGFAKLLGSLGIPRTAVRNLTGVEQTPAARLRAVTLNEAMRPATMTHLWNGFIARSDAEATRDALRGVACVETATPQEEAEVVALILREALEQPGRTAALISPDRVLARRVAVRLESWGIRIDDSAGRPFGKTVPGAFLDLVIDTVSQDFSPAALMALLRHPLTRLGLPARDVRRTARMLEIIAFRTDYLGRGLDGVDAAIRNADEQVHVTRARRQRAVTRLWDADWEATRDLATRIRAAFAPVMELFGQRKTFPLAELVKAHVATAEALAALPPDESAEDAGSPVWQGEAGDAAALLLAGLLQPELPAPEVTAADYPDFYRSLVATENVRPHLPAHPRLSIWGPFEARLQHPDIVVLGSLNEGTWPEITDAGPWLNRPMRQVLGLPQPEERIGYAAHDFTQLVGAEKVYLTRAQKADGAPTVASRWLLRLRALLDGMQISDALDADRPWLAWARARDTGIVQQPRITAPAPRPAFALRPRKLPVSDIERWTANPYALFAKTILGLEKLPDLGAEPGAALRGQIVHEALSRFAKAYPTQLPENPTEALITIARAIVTEYTGSTRVAAFWVPRLERFAHWFGETEPARRAHVTQTLAEVSGSHVLEAAGGPFIMTARADRIDIADNGLVITDYKTGGESTIKAMASKAAKGGSPQLPLEAVIALHGGFTGLDQSLIAALHYISASGGEPPGVQIPIKSDNLETLAAEARAGLLRLISEFDNPATPYRAVRRSAYDYRYDDYEHLARVKEWQGGGSDEGGGDE